MAKRVDTIVLSAATSRSLLPLLLLLCFALLCFALLRFIWGVDQFRHDCVSGGRHHWSDRRIVYHHDRRGAHRLVALYCTSIRLAGALLEEAVRDVLEYAQVDQSEDNRIEESCRRKEQNEKHYSGRTGGDGGGQSAQTKQAEQTQIGVDLFALQNYWHVCVGCKCCFGCCCKSDDTVELDDVGRVDLLNG